MSRSVRYTSSPLLASKTPVGRSRFIVAAIALGFIGLGVRAAYVQVYANDFFQRVPLPVQAHTALLQAGHVQQVVDQCAHALG